MVIVMMKQTMKHVTLMVETVVETLFTPIFVGIVFALKKKKVLTLMYLITLLYAWTSVLLGHIDF